MNHAVDLDAASRGDPVALTRALVAVPSVNPALAPDGQGEGEIAALCAGWLEGWGFDARTPEVAPGRFNVVATLGSGAPRVLLNGHLDTVGVAGLEPDPFDPVVRDGRIFGRGSCDMKGGVGSLLAAARAVGADPPPRGTLVVALTADEEHASVGMQALVDGGVTADGAVVCEPTGLSIMPCHKGFVWIDVVFRGRAAHGSRPDMGVDAVRQAALYIAGLEALHGELASAPAHPLLGRPSFHVGTISGGTAPSVYPAECRVTLERRTLPGETLEGVVTPFQQALGLAGHHNHAEWRAELEVGLHRPGTGVDEGDPVVVQLESALADEGLLPRVEGMTAWVDAAFLNRAGVPAVCFGPGDMGLAHSAEESVSIEEVRAAAAVLERFVRRFLAR